MRRRRTSKSLPSPTNSETPQNSFSAWAWNRLAFRKRSSRAVGRRASSYHPRTLIRPFGSRSVMSAWISRHAGFGAIAAYEECWSTFAVRLIISTYRMPLHPSSIFGVPSCRWSPPSIVAPSAWRISLFACTNDAKCGLPTLDRPPRLDREDLDDEVAFRVGTPAAPELVVLDGRVERVPLPLVQRV